MSTMSLSDWRRLLSRRRCISCGQVDSVPSRTAWLREGHTQHKAAPLTLIELSSRLSSRRTGKLCSPAVRVISFIYGRVSAIHIAVLGDITCRYRALRTGNRWNCMNVRLAIALRAGLC